MTKFNLLKCLRLLACLKGLGDFDGPASIRAFMSNANLIGFSRDPYLLKNKIFLFFHLPFQMN